MKAIFLNEIKKPLILKEIDIPKVNKDEILIKQEITAICYREILTQEGFFPRVKLPIIPGHEIAGKVVEVGKEVKKFKEGDYVASLIYIPCGKCSFCLKNKENLCKNRITYGEDINGSYAHYVKAKENSLVKVPRNVPIEGAIISACVIGMIINALKKANIKENDKVLITGAGGGVGIHAVQVAKSFGAKVIALTSSEWKIKKIKDMGADEIILFKEKFYEDVKKITKEGVDVVLETVGTNTFEQSFRSLKWGGKIVVIGNINVKPVSLNLGPLILKENSIIGNFSSRKKELKEALGLFSKGKVKPIVHKIYKLEEINKVYEIMKNKESLGRIFIKF